MISSQMTANPAVARLHQWPVTMNMTLTGTLRFVAERAEEVGLSTGAGITLLTTRGRRITSVATDAVAEQLGALHDRYDENAGTAAWLRRGSVVRITGPAPGLPWPDWYRRTVELGARSVLSAPVCTPQRVLGTLMVYLREADAYRRSDEDMLDHYARDAAILIDETQSARTQFFRTATTKR